jgi:hypothetical protein
MYRRLLVQGAALGASLCIFVSNASAQAAPPGAHLFVWFWSNIIVPGLGTW